MDPARTVNLPPLSFRADLTPASVNTDKRTVDLTFSTGAAVERRDWWTGDRYIEKLSLEPGAVRLGRLNAGGPLLDSHSAYSVRDMLGAVVPGTAKVANKLGAATVQFSQREDVAPIWRDVQDGLIRNVSVGYRVYTFEETRAKDGALPTRLATDWEPFELSMVPMPADPGAQTRDGKTLETNPCQIIVRGETPPAEPRQENRSMDPVKIDTKQSETILERNPLDPGAPTNGLRLTAADPKDKTPAEMATDTELARVRGIIDACEVARVGVEFRNELIDGKIPLLEAQTRIFKEIAKRGGDDVMPRQRGTRVEVEDVMIHVRSGIENALTHRLAGDLKKPNGDLYFPLTDLGRKYRGMSLMDTARVYLQGRGIRVTDMPKKELAGVALGLVDVRSGGMHTTSDFANLLADVANKTLRAAYEEQPQTFRPLVRVVQVPDFKSVNRVQLGDAPALLEVAEHGEFKTGTTSDAKETYALHTYGRKFAITRQALINDDTDAFSRVPMMFGRKARVLESNLVWGQITGNPTMGDGNALFSAAHGNLETDGDRISVPSLGRARASLRRQTSLDGEFLNLSASYLIVPTNLETLADQYVTVVTPQAAGNVNPFQNRLQVIAEPRLDEDSPLAWYLAAAAGQIDIIELAYLEGEAGPMIESRIGFDVDGLEIKTRLDVEAKIIDWRGLHKDPGELDT